ncbi:MAG: ATP-binding cassette domain-containing protein [Planctomycetes bacterium]|nr:ATP-binding cassette domain-containing protein [Planctomycetota bacterium]
MVGITLTNLTKRFAGTMAVDNVNLRIEPGELFFLLGPSGCGKTTLMRQIAGLIDPSSGTILFGDRDVTHLPTSKRNTALVFQGYALWPHMTVWQNVAFGLEVRKVAPDEKARRVTEALRVTRMSQFADRRPMQMSGGQQQRVALARALVVNPDVLLLDEPLSNLDAKLRLEMRSEIRRICTETKITSVYVTHDQEEALSIADRIAVLRDGRIAQVGTPMEVYARPRSRFVADFLGKANFIPAVVAGRDNGQLKLDSAAGTLKSAVFPDNAPAGGNVTCCVRPESIRILRNGETGANTIACRHVQTVFLGHLAQHEFRTEDGLVLTTEELKPMDRRWSEAPLRLAFDAEDLVVLTD